LLMEFYILYLNSIMLGTLAISQLLILIASNSTGACTIEL